MITPLLLMKERGYHQLDEITFPKFFNIVLWAAWITRI
jgi:hypothetical protein